jgi:hypothetical protein
VFDIRLDSYGTLGTVGTLSEVRLAWCGWHVQRGMVGTVGLIRTVRLVRLARLYGTLVCLVRYGWHVWYKGALVGFGAVQLLCLLYGLVVARLAEAW